MKARSLREIAMRNKPDKVKFPTVDLAREVAKKRKKADKSAPLDATRINHRSY